MSKVLLVKSTNFSPKYIGTPQPLGIMYLASYITKHRSDKVKLLDTRLYKDPTKEYIKILYDYKPEIIGLSALTLEASYLHTIAHLTKSINKSIKIIIGGPYVTSLSETAIKDSNIDVGVIGEGEITFKELIDAFEYNLPRNEVRGIVYKNGNTIIRTPSRQYIENIDELPFPAWDLIDIEKYFSRRSMSTIGIRPYMVLFTSRGCPFHCTYCHNILGKKFRARSAENVLKEIETLINDYHINDFEIIDDISNFNRERIKLIFKGIIERNWRISLSFPNGVRTDMLDEETILLMKNAGVKELTVSVETASIRLQKFVKKNLNLEKVNEIINIAVDNGMFVRGAFMLGFPTETEEEMKATINFACKSRLQEALFFKVNPLGGTELTNQTINVGKFPKRMSTNDHHYDYTSFNISDIPDKRFNNLYKWAYIKFYFSLGRIIRILKAKPVRNDLIILFWRVLNITFNKGDKSNRLEPIHIDLNYKNDGINNSKDNLLYKIK